MMTIVNIELGEEQVRRLQELAGRLSVSPQDLVRMSIQDLLAHPDAAFQRASAYVIEKNAELYRRLA